MSEIKTPEQAVDWCNKQLKSCAGSDRNYYYSLFEVRDIIIGLQGHNLRSKKLGSIIDDLDNQVEKLMAENSGLREQIHNVKSEDD